MSELADSTVGFSVYGLLCSSAEAIPQKVLHATLRRHGIRCAMKQFRRALNRMVAQGWVRYDEAGYCPADSGRWMPFARDRSDVDATKNPEECAGWNGWAVRSPSGDTMGLTDRLEAIGVSS